MSGRYYSDVASRLLVALASKGDPALSMSRAARLACNAITRMEQDLGPDGDLRWTVNHLNQIATPTTAPPQQQSRLPPNAPQALVGSDELFEVFLVVETRALRDAGMPQNVVDLVREAARQAKQEITRNTLDADRLLQAVRSLKGVVCGFAQEQEQIARVRNGVERAAYAIAGAATLAINGSVDAVTTLGLAPWMTQLSGGLGATMIGKVFWRSGE